MIDIDVLVDGILNENLSIDDGVSNFDALLYNKAYVVFGHTKVIHNGTSSAQRKGSFTLRAMQRLHKTATDNPREFWREIKRMEGGGSSQCKIELFDFYQHFKHVFFR